MSLDLVNKKIRELRLKASFHQEQLDEYDNVEDMHMFDHIDYAVSVLKELREELKKDLREG